MDDDDDNDDNSELQNEEEEESSSFKTYKKKKFFGKSSKDIKFVNVKTSYKPRLSSLKGLKINLEANKSQLRDDFLKSLKARLDYKVDIGGVDSRLKINAYPNGFTSRASGDWAINLKKKWSGSTLKMAGKGKLTQKVEGSVNFSHNFWLWDRFKVKYSLFFDLKEMKPNYGVNLDGQIRFNWPGVENYLPFLSQYSHIFGTELSFKSKQKYEWFQQAHLVTKNGHKAFLQHSVVRQFSKPLENVFIFNLQDKESVATFNGEVTLQSLDVKSYECRILLQLFKKYRMGVQKRNQNYQFLFERNKINLGWLKSLKFYLGNKGFLGCADGKLSFFRQSINYKLNAKCKITGRLLENIPAHMTGGIQIRYNL